MPKLRITKTLSLERGVVLALEKLAQQEKRSLTRQVEVMLESALTRQKEAAATEVNACQRSM